MALVLNSADINLKNNDPENADENIEEGTASFLIIINSDVIIKERNFQAEIVLPNDNTAFLLNFNVLENCLHMNVKPLTNEFNVNTLTLYYINSQRTFQFMESMNTSNFSLNCTYSFTKNLPIFLPPLGLLDIEKFVNNYLCIYCEVTTTDTVPIKLQIPSKNMPMDFFSLYEEKFLTDYRIICKGREFLVHKLVLVARSTVFRATIESQMQDTEDDEMKIKNFDPKIVEFMLYFIYTDDLKSNLTCEELEKLLMIADYFLLDKLKLLCMKELSKNVRNASEVLDVFTIAKTYNVKGFKEAVLEFLKNNSFKN